MEKKNTVKEIGKSLKAAFRLAVVAGGSLYFITRLRLAGPNQEKKFLKDWMGFLLKTMNIKLNVEGTPAGGQGQQVIYTPNHLSYADCIVLGSLVECSFVAADDIAKWPVIGKIAERQNTVFIEQVKGRLTDEEKQAVVERVCAKIKASLDRGSDVVLFPEGKMSPGVVVEKFRPSSLSLLYPEGKPGNQIVAQPVVLEIKKADGQDVPVAEASALRDFFAWYMVSEKPKVMNKPLPKHAWDIARSKGLELNVTFLDPMKAADFSSHVELAQEARSRIIKKLESGRRVPA